MLYAAIMVIVKDEVNGRSGNSELKLSKAKVKEIEENDAHCLLYYPLLTPSGFIPIHPYHLSHLFSSFILQKQNASVKKAPFFNSTFRTVRALKLKFVFQIANCFRYFSAYV